MVIPLDKEGGLEKQMILNLAYFQFSSLEFPEIVFQGKLYE